VGLSVVLIFVGGKMLLMDLYKLPIFASLGIIAGILAISIFASFLAPARAPFTGKALDAS
jgi:tellurite resistance protein TerC